MRIRTITFLFIVFLLLSSLTVPVIASGCDPPCEGCESCEDGVCVDDDDNCDDCYSCVDASCDWDCSAGQTCCNGTCCDNCCDGITCYDSATETCCNDGYGTVCSGSSPCCLDVPGSISFCTDYCYDSVCCSSGQSCCDNGCCDNPCCDTECCGTNQYCCGDPAWNELCCNNDEVCCWYVDGSGDFVFYCNPPCTDAVTDTTTCSEDNEDCYKCTGCKQVTPVGLTCGTYRDYTGLEIGTCYDGCPQFDWDVSDEICYVEKECFPVFHDDSLCLECGGEKVCLPVIDPAPSGGDCETIGECIVEIACDIILSCYQCEGIDTVVDTVYEETCQCN